MELTKEDIKTWVAALRSGEYKQGAGALCLTADENHECETYRFCCLGVAADLFLDNYWEKRSDSYLWGIEVGVYSHGLRGLRKTLCTQMPPQELCDAIDDALDGMGSRSNKTPTEKLALWNDGWKSFKWIADRIEHHAGLKED